MPGHDIARLLLDPEDKRRNRTLPLAKHEVPVAAELVRVQSKEFAYPLPAKGTTRDGLVRLYDRGLLTVDRVPGPAGAPPKITVGWRDQGAAAAAMRLLVRHFGHGPLTHTTLSRHRIARWLPAGQTPAPPSERPSVGPTPPRLSRTEFAMVFGWNYRHTPAHAITITDLDGTSARLTVHHHHQPDEQHLFTGDYLTAEDLTPAGTDAYADEGERFTAASLSYLVRRFARTHLPPGGSARLDLDTYTVTTPGDGTTAGDGMRLPGCVLDALAAVDAPPFTTSAEFTAWTETHLVLTLPCGPHRHRVRFDPHTHTLTPATAKMTDRHAGEHLLLALSDTPGAGCDRATQALGLFGDDSIFDQTGNSTSGPTSWPPTVATQLMVARTLGRTVQYLDAGLNLAHAAPFLRFGFTADQAARLVAAQAADPARMETLLRAWARFQYGTGPLPADQIPLDAVDGLARRAGARTPDERAHPESA